MVVILYCFSQDDGDSNGDDNNDATTKLIILMVITQLVMYIIQRFVSVARVLFEKKFII